MYLSQYPVITDRTAGFALSLEASESKNCSPLVTVLKSSLEDLVAFFFLPMKSISLTVSTPTF